MPLYRRNKRDTNEPDLIDAAHAYAGVVCDRAPSGAGYDLNVFDAVAGVLYLVEVKVPGCENHFTKRERAFIRLCLAAKVPYHVWVRDRDVQLVIESGRGVGRDGTPVRSPTVFERLEKL
jgi:hypothetical protein